jgi:hypothetical protein
MMHNISQPPLLRHASSKFNRTRRRETECSIYYLLSESGLQSRCEFCGVGKHESAVWSPSLCVQTVLFEL